MTHEEVHKLTRSVIDGLVEVITTDVKEIGKGDKNVIFECNSIDGYGYSNDYECTMYYNAKTDKIDVEVNGQYLDINDVEIGTLIDVENAIMCGNYRVEEY